MVSNKLWWIELASSESGMYHWGGLSCSQVALWEVSIKWSPILIFKQKRGKFVPGVSASVSKSQFNGVSLSGRLAAVLLICVIYTMK